MKLKKCDPRFISAVQNHCAINDASHVGVCQTRGRREELTTDFIINGPFGFATGKPRNRGTLVMEILLQNRERRKEKQVISHVRKTCITANIC